MTTKTTKKAASRFPSAGHKVKPRPKPERTRGAKEAEDGNVTPLGEEVTPRQRAFVAEYLIDLNATQAAIRAGYSPNAARTISADLMAKPNIADAIAGAMKARGQRTQVEADDVLGRLWLLANADARELSEHVIDACRYCWGEGHKLQRTATELERDRATHAEAVAAGKASAPFDELGGAGFKPTQGPNPDCPECHGRGVGVTLFKDTRRLSPGGAMLFAGVKTTRDGLEIKQHSPVDALVQVGRHLGLFAEKLILAGKVKHEHDSVGALRDFLAQRVSRLPIQTAD